LSSVNSDFLFGVSQYTTWHQSFEEDLKVFEESGAGAIELCEFKINPNKIETQFELLQESSLKVTSVQAKVHTVFPDTLEPKPENPSERIALLRKSIETIAPHIPENTPFVINTGAAPNGDIRDGWETITRELRELADFASGFGMRLAIEPLSFSDMNRNTFICQITEAMELMNDIRRPNFGVCIDTWNIWQDQLSDWRRPRVYADRYKVGDGIIPFVSLFQAIQSTGYCGAYTLEIFSPDSLPYSLWKAEPYSVIGDSFATIKDFWQQSLNSNES
jgi:sugar phosphate isomerase/epimerase